MKLRVGTAIWWLLITIVLAMGSSPAAHASLCGPVIASTDAPHSASLGKVIFMTTTVVGSCTSDGEDYFAVRVDLVDSMSNGLLSSNSTPIGYNANNFSISVRNAATAPNNAQSWEVTVNTYLIQAGATWGKYLANSTTVTIQIGSKPLSEFQPEPLIIVALGLTDVILWTSGRRFRRRFRGGSSATGVEIAELN